MASSFNNLFLFPWPSFQQSFKCGIKLNLIFNFSFKTARCKAAAPGLPHRRLHTASFAAPKSAPHLICKGIGFGTGKREPSHQVRGDGVVPGASL